MAGRILRDAAPRPDRSPHPAGAGKRRNFQPGNGLFFSQKACESEFSGKRILSEPVVTSGAFPESGREEEYHNSPRPGPEHDALTAVFREERDQENKEQPSRDIVIMHAPCRDARKCLNFSKKYTLAPLLVKN